MSGGSFNYLFIKDDADLFNRSNLLEMENMATRLLELGFEDAAKETLNLKYTIQQSLIRTQVLKDRLGDVWKAFEWYDSGDTYLEKVELKIKQYRKE
jgi:hypothetical protein